MSESFMTIPLPIKTSTSRRPKSNNCNSSGSETLPKDKPVKFPSHGDLEKMSLFSNSPIFPKANSPKNAFLGVLNLWIFNSIYLKIKQKYFWIGIFVMLLIRNWKSDIRKVFFVLLEGELVTRLQNVNRLV